MWTAIMWGGIAGSASLLGALAVLFFNVKKRIIGYIMALGVGALIAATTYELLGEAVEKAGFTEAAIGFIGGALIFTIFDIVVSTNGGHKRKHSEGRNEQESGNGGSGIAIFIGTIMDAIPESAMIGVSLIGGHAVGFSLVAAIFISNFPEGLSSTVGLKKDGYSRAKVFTMWGAVIVFSALSSLAGYALLDHASDSIQAIISAFAGGGIIAMVASTMMPEAFKEGGPAVGFITAIGVFVTLLIGSL
ncbi:ZIP family metal transporter [Virgibacillus siamensis]|uniref:ZIP family metal transporter n=1 Tax=Virgibacillus siamensis TaxID=480071 RepID=UPI0009873276|nr:ZIP family metal transporter [Virgibacillus siamensis]